LFQRWLFFPLFLTFFTAPLLWNYGSIYQFVTSVQLIFHALAGTGYLLRDLPIGRFKAFKLPLSFDMFTYASAIAVLNLATGKRCSVWRPQQSATVKATVDYVMKN
jgi:hypothetical protein